MYHRSITGRLALVGLLFFSATGFIGQSYTRGTLDYASANCVGFPTNCEGGSGGGGASPSISRLQPGGTWAEDTTEGQYGPQALILHIEETTNGIRLELTDIFANKILHWVELEQNRPRVYQNKIQQIGVDFVTHETLNLTIPSGEKLKFNRTKGALREQSLMGPLEESSFTYVPKFARACTTNANVPVNRQDLIKALRPSRYTRMVHASESIRATSTQKLPIQFSDGWVYSGGWLSDSSQLILLDSYRDRVLIYSKSGLLLEARKLPHSLTSSRVWSSNDGSLSVASFLEISNLDPSRFDGMANIKFLRSAEQSPSAFVQWAWLEEGSLAFGDVTRGDTWSTGLFWLDPKRLDAPQQIIPFDQDSIQRLYYFTGIQYLASAGDKAYFLIPSDIPSIFEVRLDLDHKPTIEELRLPLLGTYSTELLDSALIGGDAKEVFRAMELSHIPSGIFAWDNRVYLLERWPNQKKGTTEWSLRSIDFTNRTVGGQMVLPTTAAHLVVIPGTEHWAFIEKGPVVELGTQSVNGMLMIPSDAIQELGSGTTVEPIRIIGGKSMAVGR